MLNSLFGKGVIFFMTPKGYQFVGDMFQLHDVTSTDARLDKVCGRELLGMW